MPHVSYSVGLGLFTEAFGGDSLSPATETSRPHEAEQDGNWSIRHVPGPDPRDTVSQERPSGRGRRPVTTRKKHGWSASVHGCPAPRELLFHRSGGYRCEAGSGYGQRLDW
jgi:hypothetical protein